MFNFLSKSTFCVFYNESWFLGLCAGRPRTVSGASLFNFLFFAIKSIVFFTFWWCSGWLLGIISLLVFNGSWCWTQARHLKVESSIGFILALRCLIRCLFLILPTREYGGFPFLHIGNNTTALDL